MWDVVSIFLHTSNQVHIDNKQPHFEIAHARLEANFQLNEFSTKTANETL